MTEFEHESPLDRARSWTEHEPGAGADEPKREVVKASFKNHSGLPVYNLTIGWRKGPAPWGEPIRVPIVLADEEEDRQAILPAEVDRSLFSAVARFRDAAGVYWLLRPNGQLEEEPAAADPASRSQVTEPTPPREPR